MYMYSCVCTKCLLLPFADIALTCVLLEPYMYMCVVTSLATLDWGVVDIHTYMYMVGCTVCVFTQSGRHTRSL